MDMNYLKVYEKGLEKVRFMKKSFVDFPHITKDGSWLKHKNGHWTGGFWTGLLWLDSLNSGKDSDYQLARKWAMRLESRVTDNKTHDQGFIYGPSCVTGFNILNDESFIPLIHAGARNMVDLYNKESGLILAWDEIDYKGIAIVDTIMNLPLMWISDTIKGENSKKEIMNIVASNIKKYHVRENDATFHVAKWDDDYNITPGTHQGDSTYSCWSRGQAWALYGFANMYRYTHDMDYLNTSIRLATYFYNNLNENLLPAWDFIYKDNLDYPIDAAASSIAASGMLLISLLLKENGDIEGSKYWAECATNILDAEIEHCMYKDLEYYGIIEKVSVDFPRKSGVGESSMYGDYYFMEAIYRLLNLDDPKKTFVLY